MVDSMPAVYGKVFILSQFELVRLREDKVRDWLAFKRCACTERSFTDCSGKEIANADAGGVNGDGAGRRWGLTDWTQMSEAQSIESGNHFRKVLEEKSRECSKLLVEQVVWKWDVCERWTQLTRICRFGWRVG